MTSREKSVLLALSICHALIHAYMLIFPTIYKSLGSALNLEFAGVGLVGMASYLAFGFGALPAGFLADRFGSRVLLIVCLAGTTLASLMAFTVKVPGGVVIALVLMGLFASLYHPAGLSVLGTSMKEVGKALGIHGMAGTLGVALAPVIAGSITARYGWTYSYAALGGVGAVLLLYMVVGLRLGDRSTLLPKEKSSEPTRSKRISSELILIYVIGAVYGLIYRGVLTFFPSYLSANVSYIGDDIARLGLLSSGIMVVSVIGPLLGGYLASSRKTIENNLLLVFIMLSSLSLGFYFLRNLGLVLIAIPTVLLIFTFQPLQNTLIAKVSHQSQRGAAYGFNFTVSFGIGAIASGVGGIFGERFGLRSIFLLMLVLCLVELILVGASKSMRRRTENHGMS